MAINHQNTDTDQATAPISAKEQLFRDLHNGYRNRLLHSITAVVRDGERAEDITAAAFAKALQSLDNFKGKSSLYTWVHAIALNETRAEWRRKQAISLDSVARTNPAELIDTEHPAKALEQAERRARLTAALNRLPALYRRILIDHFVAGVPVKQIARLYGVPVGTVLTRIFRGKQLLRKAWGP